MKPFSFREAEFVKSAISPNDYPIMRGDNGKPMPEIAVAGRSNVGKSSLLNFLFQSRSLVKTSSTPGKTKTINFFAVDRRLCFVDLPGYGFAAGSKQEQEVWRASAGAYLHERKELKLFLILLDIRRVPSDEDFHMVQYCHDHNLPFILVFTKVDKVSPSECDVRTKAILDSLQTNERYIHTSVLKNMGREELRRLIMEIVLP